MKKLALLLISILLVGSLSGCGDKNESKKEEKKGSYVCTKVETDEDGAKTSETVTVNYDKNLVTNVKSESLMEVDKNAIDMTLSFMQLFAEGFKEIEGLNYSISKKDDHTLSQVLEMDVQKLDVDKLNELTSSEGESEDDLLSLKDKNISPEDFKTKNLEGYTCK